MKLRLKIIVLILAILGLSLFMFVNFTSTIKETSSYPCLEIHRPEFLNGSSPIDLSKVSSVTKARILTALIDIKTLQQSEASCVLQFDLKKQRELAKKIFPAESKLFDSISDVDGIHWELERLLSIYDKPTAPIIINQPKSLDCTKEKFYELGSDGAISTQILNPVIQGFYFPLKDHLTCVKDQRSRETCVSFGIIAALEAMVSVSLGKKINLSEQHLHGKAKLDWGPHPVPSSVFYINDRLHVEKTLDKATITQYIFSPENAWAYNPSPNRSLNQDTSSPNLYYSGSCDGAPGATTFNSAFCSNTNHQGKILSCPFGSWGNVFGLCNYTVNIGIPFGSSQFLPSVGGYQSLPPNSAGVAAAKFFLAQKKPLVALLYTNSEFYEPVNGIIEDRQSNKVTGHAVTVVGSIDNSNLPTGIPSGLGGGYFIIKNSWGTSWGLGGYALLSYQYYTEYGQSLTLINIGLPVMPL